MNNVFVVARLFPPYSDGGIFRIHAFVKYLPENNWRPIVLTVKEEYIPKNQQDQTLLNDYDTQTNIIRTKTLEPNTGYFQELRKQVTGVRKTSPWFESKAKPLLRSIYRLIAIPDEYILWFPAAIKAGKKVIKENKIDHILVTSPPHSAAVIAAYLSKISNIPLIWDVRDDWVGNPYYTNSYPRLYRILSRFLEKKIVQIAHSIITVTTESLQSFQIKYPTEPTSKFHLIRNGYDAKDTASARIGLPKRNGNKLRIIYTGILPSKRNPTAFFQALKELNQEQPLHDCLQADFYGNIRQDFIDLADNMGLEGIVNFIGQVPRIESIRRIINAEVGLIIITQEEGSQTAIPGKLYEYIGAQKIVLALCPQDSACAKLVREKKFGISTEVNDVAGIKQILKTMLDEYARGQLTIQYQPNDVVEFERSYQTKLLSNILGSISRTSIH